MLVIGIEPAITAAAPVSGGGGLFDVGLRTELSTARNPIWLRVMGPIFVSEADEACEEGTQIRVLMPDLSERVSAPIACADLDEGDVVAIANQQNGEVRCAGVDAEGRFRIQLPTSEGDPLSITIYDGGTDTIDYG